MPEDAKSSTHDDTSPQPSRHGKVVTPLNGNLDANSNPAADLIRQKINQMYTDEPNASEEIAETEAIIPSERSKHQQFMHEISNSGRSLAEIQTAWHDYYTNLPNDQKHEVWQEFYSNHDTQVTTDPKLANPQVVEQAASGPQDTRSVSTVKQELLQKVQKRSKAQKNPHLQSLVFGLGTGAIVLLVFLFGFFNERFIAPFITPARAVSSTPIIIDPATSAVGPESKVIIPKINVEIPIDFDEPTIDEDAIQRALEKGVVHYPTTSNPGEVGNGAIFGHSANNILNPGKYKFAFVLLNRLESGDTFYVQKDGVRYVYKVFDKKVVTPQQVEVLHATFEGKPSTMTLITCDPPGTSLNRLVVVGEQISPNPANNAPSSATSTVTQDQGEPEQLPSNSVTLWQRIKNWF